MPASSASSSSTRPPSSRCGKPLSSASTSWRRNGATSSWRFPTGPRASHGHILLALRAVQSLLEWRVSTSPDMAEAVAMPWDTLADDIPKLVTAYLGHDA
ncbi:hypothetical protein ACFYY1_31490 [Streptomyces sp. NPDC001890]|uniref:hypothetical protein n=1 Tax=Streptomyces sp. NPDC001890 TaxID=3364620 RepID=UPI0036CE40AF